MNPFDFRSVLFARHAQHVVLIHFPIALCLVSIIFDFVAHWTRKSALAIAARYNLLVAAISSLPVMATGILAWRWQFEGQPLRGVLLLHLSLGALSSGLIWLIWWIHFRASRPGQTLPAYRLPIEIVSAAVIGLTAHLGGFLSGVNGPG